MLTLWIITKLAAWIAARGNLTDDDIAYGYVSDIWKDQ